MTNNPVLFFWLPSIYFVLHTLEEIPGFAPWVTQHFGPMTTLSFVMTHIPLLLLTFYASYRASKEQRNTGWAILCTAIMFEFVFNAIFHFTTATLFNEYSPGMFTAAILSFLFCAYYIRRIRTEKRLTTIQLIWATWWGLLLAAAAIGVLFLH